ncbi:TetR/AcrR family transcriptional regulator [Kineococcus sp. NBC_00420]|uniref:TetR/AcrR family transcriptional regulator n=1 Tax=Kineococcus sp. NBC_00420 TaxID=2903564 RepID=UPI002E203E0A
MNTPPAGPVPRVPREEVRRRLLEAAWQVFATKGYANARLDEIAYAAGFTKGAVYSNFSSKHALLAHLIQERVREYSAEQVRSIRSQRRPVHVLEDAAAAFAHAVVHQQVWTRLLVEIGQQAAQDEEVQALYVNVRRQLRQDLTDVLSRAFAALGLRSVVTPEQLSLTLQSLTLGLTVEHGTDPQEVDEQTVTAVFTAVLRSLVHRPE